MNKKLRELIKQLDQFKFNCMFSSKIQVMAYLTLGEGQVSLSEHGDYLNLPEAVSNLRELSGILEEIDKEIQK